MLWYVIQQTMIIRFNIYCFVLKMHFYFRHDIYQTGCWVFSNSSWEFASFEANNCTSCLISACGRIILTQLRQWIGFGIHAINTKLKYNKGKYLFTYLLNLFPMFTRKREINLNISWVGFFRNKRREQIIIRKTLVAIKGDKFKPVANKKNITPMAGVICSLSWTINVALIHVY